ncbi:hypothetical protein ACTJJ7_15385 [Phyllobacterium sp. 22229]|uniref:hypothetical protein n=1 Tax=Phyllobacterium sp. 22229 TaxID=3453895 RepID=UPI003F871BC0
MTQIDELLARLEARAKAYDEATEPLEYTGDDKILDREADTLIRSLVAERDRERKWLEELAQAIVDHFRIETPSDGFYNITATAYEILDGDFTTDSDADRRATAAEAENAVLREVFSNFLPIIDAILAEAPAEASQYIMFIDCEGNRHGVNLDILRRARAAGRRE